MAKIYAFPIRMRGNTFSNAPNRKIRQKPLLSVVYLLPALQRSSRRRKSPGPNLTLDTTSQNPDALREQIIALRQQIISLTQQLDTVTKKSDGYRKALAAAMIEYRQLLNYATTLQQFAMGENPTQGRTVREVRAAFEKILTRELIVASRQMIEENDKHDFTNCLCSVQLVTPSEEAGVDHVRQLTWDEHDVIVKWPVPVRRWLRKKLFSRNLSQTDIPLVQTVPRWLYEDLFKQVKENKIKPGDFIRFRGDLIAESKIDLERRWKKREIRKEDYQKAKQYIRKAEGYIRHFIRADSRNAATEHVLFPIIIDNKVRAVIYLAAFGHLEENQKNWERISDLVKEIHQNVRYWSLALSPPPTGVSPEQFCVNLAQDLRNQRAPMNSPRAWILGPEFLFNAASPFLKECLKADLLALHFSDPADEVSRAGAKYARAARLQRFMDRFSEQFKREATTLAVYETLGHFNDPKTTKIVEEFFNNLKTVTEPYHQLARLMERGYLQKVIQTTPDPLLQHALEALGLQKDKDFIVITANNFETLLPLIHEGKLPPIQIIQLRRMGELSRDGLPKKFHDFLDSGILDSTHGYVALNPWPDRAVQELLKKRVYTADHLRAANLDSLAMEDFAADRSDLFSEFLDRFGAREISFSVFDSLTEIPQRLIYELSLLDINGTWS